MGRGWRVMRGKWEISGPFSQFSCEPTTVRENEILIKLTRNVSDYFT